MAVPGHAIIDQTSGPRERKIAVAYPADSPLGHPRARACCAHDASIPPRMNTYACLQHQRFEHRGHALVPVQPEHIEPIRLWRNAQMDVLRQSAPITAPQQQAYFERHIWPTQVLTHPPQILVGFLQDDQLIGYGGLVHVAWEHRRAEVSFLLDPARTRREAAYAADFLAFLHLIKVLAFDDLGLHRLYTETYAIRTHHITVLEAAHFQPEGRLRAHVWIDGQAVDSLMHGCLASDAR